MSELSDRDSEFRNISEPPLGQSAVSSEIAKQFPQGIFSGAVASFKEDEEDATDEGGIYHVIYADGDAEDLDHTEYVEAFHLNEAQNADAAAKRQRNNPPPPPIRLEYKPGDTYSFRLTDDSFKGLEQVAKELGWYEEGVRKGAKAKKKKVQRDDIFICKETRGLLCRVMKTTAGHASFGDLKGTITARPFISYDGTMPHHALPSHGRADFEMLECDYLYVRPSAIITVTGTLERAQGLRIALDPTAYMENVVALNLNLANWTDLYQDDEGLKKNPASLMEILGALPMFANELSWIAQVVQDFGNKLEISPIVHCELAGRGIEYANGRATWDFRNGCTGKIADLEGLCRRAFSACVIPHHLTAKYERRVRDYMRSYRMGVLSNGLEKMRAVIKTHRNMLDSYESFIRSDGADDATDAHCFDPTSVVAAVNKAMGIKPKLYEWDAYKNELPV